MQEAQDFREEAIDEVKAKVVEEAPGAILASGTGDVSTTNACAGDIDNFCPETKPGEGRIADCLTKQLDEEAKGNVEGGRYSILSFIIPSTVFMPLLGLVGAMITPTKGLDNVKARLEGVGALGTVSCCKSLCNELGQMIMY